jgi:hypothetical protein
MGVVAGLQIIEQARVPGCLWLSRDIEAHPPVCIDGPRTALAHGHSQCAPKILVLIARGKAEFALAPSRHDAAAAHHLVRLYFEQVSKIASERDFQIEANRLHAVIHNLQVFVNASGEAAPDLKPDSAGWNCSLLGGNGSIDQANPHRVMRNVCEIEQIPALAVSPDLPTAEQACIEEVQTFVAGRMNLTVVLGNKRAIALVDDGVGRTNCNFKRHSASLADVSV